MSAHPDRSAATPCPRLSACFSTDCTCHPRAAERMATLEARPLYEGWAVVMKSHSGEWTLAAFTARTRWEAIKCFDDYRCAGDFTRRRRAGTARCVRVHIVAAPETP